MNKKQFFSAPFLVFMLCGTIIPLGVIAFYGLTDRSGAFTFDNITAITTPEHMEALVLSLLLAFISTVICLIIAFPLGLILRDSGIGKKGFIVFTEHKQDPPYKMCRTVCFVRTVRKYYSIFAAALAICACFKYAFIWRFLQIIHFR